MKNYSIQPKKSRKKAYVFAGISILIVLVISLAWWIYTTTLTYPLGDKLEYVGKKDTGCYISLTICDSRPSTTYYYATNLSQNELTRYFKNTSEAEVESSAVTTSTGYTYDYVTFHLPNTPDLINVSYYTDSALITRDMKLQPSSKRHVISINSKYYAALRESL
jgi:hypothetical protein